MRLKLWKMKPIFSLRSFGAGVVREVGDFHAVELVAAALVGLEQSRDVEEGGLAGARGARDREELPAFTSSEKSRSACVSMRSVRKTLLTLFIESMVDPQVVEGCGRPKNRT